MLNPLLRLISSLLLCAAASALAADQGRNLEVTLPHQSARIALVIGNAAYPGVAALRNATNDANDMAAKLRTLHFDVTLNLDVGLKDMLRTLTAFGNKIKPGSEVLVYYAGHGMQVRGKNYLIPVDAEISSEISVSSEAVDVDQLLDKLAHARLSMIILDACRNNPFERRFRGGGQGLAFINAPSGTLIAYATAPGKVASDGDGRNGLYTRELLAAMDLPGLKVEDVFKRVRANVARATGESQVPWEASSLTGDFFFSGASTAGYQPQVLTDAEIEQAFWDTVKDSAHAGDYQRYLSQYPNGRFAALASVRIDALKVNAPQQRAAESLRAIQLQIGEQFDKVSLYPMQICDYSRPISTLMDAAMHRQASHKLAGVDLVGDTADAVLSIQPIKVSLSKAPEQNSDYVNVMRLVVESKLTIGGQLVSVKNYEERSTSKYASCCTCAAWDSEIDSELKKVTDSLVSRILSDLATFQNR